MHAIVSLYSLILHRTIHYSIMVISITSSPLFKKSRFEIAHKHEYISYVLYTITLVGRKRVITGYVTDQTHSKLPRAEQQSTIPNGHDASTLHFKPKTRRFFTKKGTNKIIFPEFSSVFLWASPRQQCESLPSFVKLFR
ncbi:hypothetical protein RND81_08G060300 [Saponaria officinalis]|uniref:Uncharacterized protein n=1 Tax=Saponaria officinalis TaxID=3572 RepID=A0AAW1J4B1_SAPOF